MLRSIVVHRGASGNFTIDAIAHAQGVKIEAYVDDRDSSDSYGIVPVVSYATWCERMREIPSVVTALDPAERRAIVERLRAAGGNVATFPRAGKGVSHQTTFGEGTLVDEGALWIGRLTELGQHAIVMTPTCLGHDIVIGNFVTIFPSATVSGHVVLEDDVTVGVGAVISNGRSDKPIRIGRGTTLLSGAVVLKSVAPGRTVGGNPARPVSV